MGVTGAITAGAAVAGAGASIYGSMNASDAADSAADSSQSTSENNAMLNMDGFYASKQTLEDQAQKAREAYDWATLNQDGAAREALATLRKGETYWNDAYDQGSAALNSGISEWDSKYNQIVADEAQYMALGQQGLTGYSGLLSDPTSITTDPGYQFRLDQGIQGLDRSAAAKGKLFSGAQGKAVTEYGQNYATSEYDKALARYKSAIDTGQTATTQVNSAGQNTASGKANLYNSLASLATNRATGLSSNAAQQASVYQGWGDDMSSIASNKANNENNLGQNVVSAWQSAANNITGSNTTNTDNANQATTAGASAENQGLTGAANSLNTGVSNYLKSSSNSSSYVSPSNNTFTNGSGNISGWNFNT